MCPNGRGLGMPIFIMLCLSDVKSGQESMALKLMMKVVFYKMGSVRPNAIIIDKCMTKFNALKDVIDEDLWCWKSMKHARYKQNVIVCYVGFMLKKLGLRTFYQKFPR